ncbi:MAG: hypothetical protein WCV85_03490 [Patescibacteria group bacterium]
MSTSHSVQRGKPRKPKAAKGWQGFDDCPICQAMQNGTANSVEGLMAAFQAAKRKYLEGSFVTKKVK